MTERRLIADVGGTNVRFACVPARSPEAVRIPGPDNRPENIRVYPTAAYPAFEAALAAYVAEVGPDIRFSSAVIAAAGPVEDGRIDLTNASWQISAAALRQALGNAVDVELLNDLEAVAHALPHLAGSDLDSITPGLPPPQSPRRMLAVNVGTGFGSAVIINRDGQWMSCPSESGHMRLDARDQADLAVFSAAGLTFPTVEDFLSGRGLLALHRAIAAMRQPAGQTIGADHQVTFGAPDPVSRQTLACFTNFLARTCSNLTLASAAWDGVFLCGSVAKAWAEQADRDAFVADFVGGGPMQAKLAGTPIAIITSDEPALAGLAHYEFRRPVI